MAFRHLIRVGRHWLNPRYVVRIEDTSRAACPGPPGDLLLVMVRGEPIPLGGDDAAELRRILDDADDGRPTPVAPEPSDVGPGRVESGHGPGLLVRPADVGRKRRVSK